MKTYLKWALMLPLIASISLVGCNKDDDESPAPSPVDPMADKVELFSGSADGAMVDMKVYADAEPFAGYNRIYVRLFEKDSDIPVKSAQVTLLPEMAMNSGMMHTAPVESPENSSSDEGIYQGAVVFVMPSMAGTWKLNVEVLNNANGEKGTYGEEVTVMQPEEPKMFSFLSPVDGTSYFVSMVEPMKPEVGPNDFEMVIHKRGEMGMSWPAVTDFKVDIEPYMPTMSHGTPHTDPSHTSMGHYTGDINFSMSGLWYIYVALDDADDNLLVDEMDQYFEMTLTE
jgi:hypothetical protein